jgi:hypothetical protein
MAEQQRAWLDVPYAEKDEATKALGARWDPAAKHWCAPCLGLRGLDRLAARPEVPALLPGEGRSFGSGCSWTWCPRRATPPAGCPGESIRTVPPSIFLHP